jgi:hypothetical protein
MGTSAEGSRAVLIDLNMSLIAEIRKTFLKERLIPTISVGTIKRRAAKAALKVKQGENQTHSPNGETV